MVSEIINRFSNVVGQSGLRFLVHPPVEDKGFETSARLLILNLQSDPSVLLEDVLIEGCPPLTNDQTEYGGRIIRTEVDNGRLKVWGRIETPHHGEKSESPPGEGASAQNGHAYSHRFFTGYYR